MNSNVSGNTQMVQLMQGWLKLIRNVVSSVNGYFDFVVLNQHKHFKFASLVEWKVWHVAFFAAPATIGTVHADNCVPGMWVVESYVKAKSKIHGLHAWTVLQIDFESFLIFNQIMFSRLMLLSFFFNIYLLLWWGISAEIWTNLPGVAPWAPNTEPENGTAGWLISGPLEAAPPEKTILCTETSPLMLSLATSEIGTLWL